MRIGIYLGYEPNVVLNAEGLGRYLGGLIKGFLDANEEVILVIPAWSKKSIENLFQDFDIPSASVSTVLLHHLPFIWSIYSFLEKRKHVKRKPGIKYRIKQSALSFVESIMYFFLRSTYAAVFFLAAILAGLILIIISIICFIVGIIVSPVLLIYSVITKSYFRLMQLIHGNINIIPSLKRFVFSRQRQWYEYMTKETRIRLVQRANTEEVDVWLITTLFWPETKELRKARVNVVPDMVGELYASDFAVDLATTSRVDLCRDTIDNGNYFITYSEYVNQTTLKERYHKYNGVAIPIAYTPLSRWVKVNGTMLSLSGESLSEIYARHLLQTLPMDYLFFPKEYCNFSFENVHYIFYPSQVRPHKNIHTLIKAYHHILKYKNCNVKLILTCNPRLLRKDTMEYIECNKLYFDILFFHGIHVQLLAALYKCADLVVNPTLYEGGFPVFTFGEGMSVGTPSVMGRIPQTMYIMKDYPLIEKEALFDPYDEIDMANVIDWGLRNQHRLYQDELVLYETVQARTDEAVAKDYISYFSHVLSQEHT